MKCGLILLDNQDVSNQENFQINKTSLLLFEELVFTLMIEGPTDWHLLSRSHKDKYPAIRASIHQFRENVALQKKKLQDAGITIKKEVLFYSNNKEKRISILEKSNLVFIGSVKCIQVFARHFHQEFEKSTVAIIPGQVEETLSDIVFSSQFLPIEKASSSIIRRMEQQINPHLHLVYLNSPAYQQNSIESVENMKNTVQQEGFAKTSISIFYAENPFKGISEFCELKDSAVALIEYNFSELVWESIPMENPVELIFVNNRKRQSDYLTQ